MLKRQKILLGKEDIKIRENEDFSIDINLSGNLREIVPYKKENNFNLAIQYAKERNNSRDFRIYGTIESIFEDCDNLIVHVFSKKPDVEGLEVEIQANANIDTFEGYMKTTKTSSVISNAWNPVNIFNKKKGKFLVELDHDIDGYSDGELDFVYLYFPELNDDQENLFKRQLVYRYKTLNFQGEPSIELIPYGNTDIFIDIDGNYIDVQNDFDFFFNKHWIKENIKLNYSRSMYWRHETGVCDSIVRDIKLIPYTDSSVCEDGERVYYDLIWVFSDTLAPVPDKDLVPNDGTVIPEVLNVSDDSCETFSILTVINGNTVAGVDEILGKGYVKVRDQQGDPHGYLFDIGESAFLEAVPLPGYAFHGFDIDPTITNSRKPNPDPASDVEIINPQSDWFLGSRVCNANTTPSNNISIPMITNRTVKANFVLEVSLQIIGADFWVSNLYCTERKLLDGQTYSFPVGYRVNILRSSADDPSSGSKTVYVAEGANPVDTLTYTPISDYLYKSNVYYEGFPASFTVTENTIIQKTI